MILLVRYVIEKVALINYSEYEFLLSHFYMIKLIILFV